MSHSGNVKEIVFDEKKILLVGTAHISQSSVDEVNKVIEQEKMQEYAAGAGPTLASAGAKVLVRGAVAETLAGDLSGDIALVIEFPDIETARNWYQSPEYQAMISTREN